MIMHALSQGSGIKLLPRKNRDMLESVYSVLNALT
jgi:hypothetical protein